MDEIHVAVERSISAPSVVSTCMSLPRDLFGCFGLQSGQENAARKAAHLRRHGERLPFAEHLNGKVFPVEFPNLKASLALCLVIDRRAQCHG
jgi:hypothetical protein